MNAEFYAAIRKYAAASPLAEEVDVALDPTPGKLVIYAGGAKIAEGTGKNEYEAGIDALTNLYVDNQR